IHPKTLRLTVAVTPSSDFPLSGRELRSGTIFFSIFAPENRIPPQLSRGQAFLENALKCSGRVGHHAISAVPLGAVERLVGALDDGRGIVIGPQRRDADRDGDLDPPAALLD